MHFIFTINVRNNEELNSTKAFSLPMSLTCHILLEGSNALNQQSLN